MRLSLGMMLRIFVSDHGSDLTQKSRVSVSGQFRFHKCMLYFNVFLPSLLQPDSFWMTLLNDFSYWSMKHCLNLGGASHLAFPWLSGHMRVRLAGLLTCSDVVQFRYCIICCLIWPPGISTTHQWENSQELALFELLCLIIILSHFDVSNSVRAIVSHILQQNLTERCCFLPCLRWLQSQHGCQLLAQSCIVLLTVSLCWAFHCVPSIFLVDCHACIQPDSCS